MLSRLVSREGVEECELLNVQLLLLLLFIWGIFDLTTTEDAVVVVVAVVVVLLLLAGSGLEFKSSVADEERVAIP